MIEYKDIIKHAPLPFAGQKRFFVKKLYDYFHNLEYKPSRVIDCFGGSGLLSNLFKQMYPDIEVIYNDYDSYFEKIEEIPYLNEVLAKCRTILARHKIEHRAKITSNCKIELEEYLKDIDWTKVSKGTVYMYFSLIGIGTVGDLYVNKVRRTDFIYDERYCKGCVVKHCDYILFTSKRSGAYDIINHYCTKEFWSEIIWGKSAVNITRNTNEVAYIKLEK
nr:MAG TPA: methyltransferase [Caudoviricetes sp.]